MSNVYESGSQKVIPAVLLYAFYQNKVLMIHGRGKDGMPGKWNGLGGKLDLGESMKQAAAREFKEEASCATHPTQWAWLGQLYFPNFKGHKKEDWWVNVYATELSEAQVKEIPVQDANQPEGELHFIDTEKVSTLDLWDGDVHFLPFVFKRTPFEGTFFYENGKCTRHEIHLIK